MEEILYRDRYPVESGSFATAGDASRTMKNTLKRMGIDPAVIRAFAIACYELELNLVIHSDGGELSLAVMPDRVRLTSADRGPGIPDIALALQEGYSTAPQEVRNMGFGAGMGLPNIRRHSHRFSIESVPGKGTTIVSEYDLSGRDARK